MSALPIALPNGIIAIYGQGTKTSLTGIIITDEQSSTRFGIVSQVYSGGEVFIYGGDSVMFKDEDVYDRIVYNDYPYTLVPARLATKEEPLL